MRAHPMFFLAILPPLDIQVEIRAFKEYVAEYFNSKKALTSPPHITLIPPFVWPLEKLPSLQKTLTDFVEKQTAFSLRLKNFDHFGSGVIFVNVEENEPLTALQEALRAHLERTIDLKYKRSGRPFHAHATVAYRDLTEDQFPAAWAHFSKVKYEALFHVQQIVLLERVEKRWEVMEQFDFVF